MNKEELCGCGKPARYTIKRNGETIGSCNKYIRCSSYEELEEYNKLLRSALINYRDAMEKTRTYIGKKELPEVDGMAWFEADKYAKKIIDGDINMNKEEYKNEISKITNKCNQDKKNLNIKYAKENNKVKIGDIIEDHSIKIKVGKINFYIDVDGIPGCIYSGKLITKKNEFYKDERIDEIYQSNLKGEK